MKRSQLSVFLRETTLRSDNDSIDLVDACPKTQCPYRGSGACPKILTVNQVPVKKFLDVIPYFKDIDPTHHIFSSIVRVNDGGVEGYDYGIFLADDRKK